MSTGGHSRPVPARERRRLVVRPTTRLGTWAVGLAAAHLVLMLGWRLLGPLGGFPGLAFGLAGGVVALVAILRRGERALTVYAALVFLLNTVLFVLGSLLLGG